MLFGRPKADPSSGKGKSLINRVSSLSRQFLIKVFTQKFQGKDSGFQNPCQRICVTAGWCGEVVNGLSLFHQDNTYRMPITKAVLSLSTPASEHLSLTIQKIHADLSEKEILAGFNALPTMLMIYHHGWICVKTNSVNLE